MTQKARWWNWTGFLTAGVMLVTCLPALADHHEEKGSPAAALQTFIAGSHRNEADKARDQYRHPAETLSFFGIKDNMTVVEIWPGAGWYTDILAPFLKERGTYYVAGVDPEAVSKAGRATVQKYTEKLTANPDLFNKIKQTVLAPPTKTDIAPEGSADMVLTFRNVHNWMARDQAATAFQAMYKALKPGGVLGVVEHRAKTDVPQDPRQPPAMCEKMKSSSWQNKQASNSRIVPRSTPTQKIRRTIRKGCGPCHPRYA